MEKLLLAAIQLHDEESIPKINFIVNKNFMFGFRFLTRSRIFSPFKFFDHETEMIEMSLQHARSTLKV